MEENTFPEDLNDDIFCYECSNQDFTYDINENADKINDEKLNDEQASEVSEISTNGKTKNYSTTNN